MYRLGQAKSPDLLNSPPASAAAGAVAGGVAGFLWPTGKGTKAVLRSAATYAGVGAILAFGLSLYRIRAGSLPGEAT